MQLQQEEIALWEELWKELEPVAPSPNLDSVSWNLEPSGIFLVSSLYNKLCAGASPDYAKTIWSAWIFLKIKIFT